MRAEKGMMQIKVNPLADRYNFNEVLVGPY